MSDLQLLRRLYESTTVLDWRTARERALDLLTRQLGLRSISWATASAGCKSGMFNETWSTGFTGAMLLSTNTPVGVLAPSNWGGGMWIFRYVHTEGAGQIHSVFAIKAAGNGLRNQELPSLPEPERTQHLLEHLAEASSLFLKLYIQRDEWLMSMGRNNRGAAALVDSAGVVHASSDRFDALLLPTVGGQSVHTLRFALPEAILDEGGSFLHAGLHMRVEVMGGIYLVYGRKPLPLDVLSPREQQIARALSAGKTFKSVAKQCDIAVSTVANHATRIYRKLGIYRREELVELLGSTGRTEADAAIGVKKRATVRVPVPALI